MTQIAGKPIIIEKLPNVQVKKIDGENIGYSKQENSYKPDNKHSIGFSAGDLYYVATVPAKSKLGQLKEGDQVQYNGKIGTVKFFENDKDTQKSYNSFRLKEFGASAVLSGFVAVVGGTTGAAIGAGIGALSGSLITHSSAGAAKGAVAGAKIGGSIAGIIGGALGYGLSKVHFC